MDQSVFLVVDFSAVCRLCLSGRLLSDIHEEESHTDPDPPLLLDQIALVTGVQIAREDSLPQRICYKCRHLVDLASELRAAAVRTEGLLIHALADAAPKYSEHLRPIQSIEDQISDHLKQPAVRYIHTGDKDNPREIINTEQISDAKDFGNAQCDAIKLEDNNTGDPHVIEDTAEESIATEIKWENANVAATTQSPAAKRISHINLKPKRKNVCEICLTTFPSRDKLLAHVRQHYAGSGLTPYAELRRPLRCERCARPVSGRRELLEHHLRHLDVNPFVCREPGCSFVGKSKDSLRQHGYRHRARSFVCESCGAAFRRTWELQQHSIRHTDEGAPYPCRLCRVVCRNRLTLRAHLNSHELGRRFRCERLGCPKAFFQRSDLLVHERSHDNKRIFRCHLCISSYISQSQLNRHLRMHQQRRVNKCDKCSATFGNYTEYFNHRVGTHGAFQPHKCIGCNQGYQSEPRLQTHMARCKLAQNMRKLLPREVSPLQMPAEQQGVSNEESSEGLDALLGRGLEAASAPADGVTHGEAQQEAAPPPEGLPYAEDDVSMQSYPSPCPSPTAPATRDQQQ